MGEQKQPRKSGSQRRPLMWGQLLGWILVEEQNLTLSTSPYSLFSETETNHGQGLEHSSVEPLRKKGVQWQAPHQGGSVTHEMMVLTTTSFIFSQMASLLTPFWLR